MLLQMLMAAAAAAAAAAAVAPQEPRQLLPQSWPRATWAALLRCQQNHVLIALVVLLACRNSSKRGQGQVSVHPQMQATGQGVSRGQAETSCAEVGGERAAVHKHHTCYAEALQSCRMLQRAGGDIALHHCNKEKQQCSMYPSLHSCAPSVEARRQCCCCKQPKPSKSIGKSCWGLG